MSRIKLPRTLALISLSVLGAGTPALAQEIGPPPTASASGTAFHGFQRISTIAQGQVATGYFFAIGDEINRVVGARVEAVGPPTNSRATAAFIQRGIGATYVYGVAGGPGGTSGKLPDPPPGEAPAYYPTAPQEFTYEGPVTTGLGGKPGEARTVDGRFHAKAGDDASGVADAAVVRVEVPDAFRLDQASVVSRSGPTAKGLEADSTSILQGVTVGPLRIETLVSRASGFVPAAPGDPTGTAETIVEGATVDEVPVKITSSGVIVADQTNPDAQEQVQAALIAAGLTDIRLLTAETVAAQGGQQLSAQAGGIRVVKRDRNFGNSNPQGVQGGGFAIGGAEISVTGTRCQPACAADPGTSDDSAASSDPAAASVPAGARYPLASRLVAGPVPPTGPQPVPVSPTGVTTAAGSETEAAAAPSPGGASDPEAEPGSLPGNGGTLVVSGRDELDGGDARQIERLLLAGAGAAVLVGLARRLAQVQLTRRTAS